MYYEEKTDNLLFRPDPEPVNKKSDIKRFPPIEDLRFRNKKRIQEELNEQKRLQVKPKRKQKKK